MKKIGGSCFRTEGKPRLEELSDKFHSSKSSAESKSVTESSGFDSKARIMVSWSGRKRTSSILILLTTVGKRVNNLAKEQWFDCTIRRSIVEKPINFPPSPFRNFQFLTTSTAGGVKRKLHIIHRETSLQRPFPMKRDRGMNAKSVETNVGWIAFNDNTSLLFQFLSSSSVSFRDERNTAERNLIEENKSGSRAQNSFCPRFLPARIESSPRLLLQSQQSLDEVGDSVINYVHTLETELSWKRGSSQSSANKFYSGGESPPLLPPVTNM